MTLLPSSTRPFVRGELRPLAALAWPVVTAEIGWVTMWLVDTMMVGRIGAEAIGAVSIGGHLFFAVAVFGMGMLLGLDYVVAHAVGAGRIRDAHRALRDGVLLSIALTVGLSVLVFAAIRVLPRTGIRPEILADAVPYLRVSVWGLLPLLLFSALRRYLQAMNRVQPVMVALVSANLVNAAADWILIFGHLGAPALGVVGAGWATTISRCYMLACLLAYTLWRERRHPSGLWRTPLRIDRARLRRLVGLGLPAACQTSLEVGVFMVVTLLAGMVGAAAVAAHQVALSAAAFTFMVPLGLSSAGAVRVGQALGRGDPAAAARAGWAALALGAGFMTAAGIAFVLAPGAILRVFTTDPSVLAAGTSLLMIAAAFQLFDGLQVVGTGVLRGTGDTRTPMLVNLAGYWFLGLPLGAFLCFRGDLGVVGLWIGLCFGLIVVALTLVWAWVRRVTTLVAPVAVAAERVA